MKENFVNYDLAIKLKDFGFNYECFGCYNFDGSYFDEEEQKYKKYDSRYLILIDEAQRSYNNEFLRFTSNEHLWILAPLHQQVTKWLREVHNVYIHVIRGDKIDAYTTQIWKIKAEYDDTKIVEGKHWVNTYEQALDSAILESLKLIKK